MSMTTMKMAAVCGTPLLLLLCCSVICSTESQTKCDHAAAQGEAFTVPLGHQLKDTDRVKWRHGAGLIVDRKPPSKGAVGKDYNFVKGSSDDIFQNGSLNLRNVKKTDAGEYTPLVYREDGESVAVIKSVHLCVLDRAPKPTLKQDCMKNKVKLTCDVGKGKDLKFVWLQNDKVLKNKISKDLTLEFKDVGQHSFSCRVSNPLGSNTSDPVTDLCNLSPGSIFGIDLWVIIWTCVGVGGGLVLLLTIIVIVCCVRAKRKKRIQEKDVDELRLRFAHPEQQQQHQCPQHGHPASRRHQHQHQHQDQDQDKHQDQQQHLQQQPAGHTGPRQHRSKQQRPRAPEPPAANPQPNPRRPAQATRGDATGDDEQPPPLPQPRSKTPRARV